MSESTNQLVENFFRHESANLIAVLTRAFGLRRLEMIEDMVQVAMLEAMHAWKQRGVPDKPVAWIHRVATQRIIDTLRREKVYEKAIALTGQTLKSQETLVEKWLEDEQLPDSLLRMIFVCCHPSLDRENQIALTLKTLCGFGLSEIAQGLLLPVETIKKRVQRSRKALSEAGIQLELPPPDQLVQRLDVVHDVLYLMFNEGYSASSGNEPVRLDICEEAARLCHLLCLSPYSTPTSRALLALLLFHAARLDARTDTDGAVILLEEQNREAWDRELIQTAQGWLAHSRTDRPTTFHLEAAIAMQHCISPSAAETDWETIICLYDRLTQLRDSPVYALNRAIAVGQAGRTRDAIEQLQKLQVRGDMKNYLLLDCAFARIHELEGNRRLAVGRLEIALSKADAPHIKALLQRRLDALSRSNT